MAIGVRNVIKTGQLGDGREAAAADYVVVHSQSGDVDDVIRTIDKFAYEKSFLVNIGDEKGELLEAAVRRAYSDDEDIDAALVPDMQGIGSGTDVMSHPPPPASPPARDIRRPLADTAGARQG